MSRSYILSILFLFSIVVSSFGADKNNIVIAKALAHDVIENAPLQTVRTFNA